MPRILRYPTGIPLLKRGRPAAEPKGRFRVGHHQRLRGGPAAVVGCFAHNLGAGRRAQLLDAKKRPPLDPAYVEELAEAMADLARLYSGGVWPDGTVVAAPPQGASAPGPHAAGAIAQATAGRLGLQYLDLLRRTDVKRHHGPWDSRRQSAYRVEAPDPRPSFVLVVDDFITSGTTMRLSIEALRSAGIPCAGICYSGH